MVPLRAVRDLHAEDGDTVRVPIIGAALCAGFPSPADDFLEGDLGLPRWMAPNPPATFIWRVSGWSVVGAGIHDKDLIVIDRSLTPIRDDIVVATIDGVNSLKRYRIVGNRPMLAFDNPDLPAEPLDEIGEAAIWGVASFNLRLLRPIGWGRR